VCERNYERGARDGNSHGARLQIGRAAVLIRSNAADSSAPAPTGSPAPSSS
jgi:hypothetical protein